MPSHVVLKTFPQEVLTLETFPQEVPALVPKQRNLPFQSWVGTHPTNEIALHVLLDTCRKTVTAATIQVNSLNPVICRKVFSSIT